MTISNQDARTGPYNGNGSTTSFAYDFKVIDEDHLVVTLKDSSDVETVQTITTNYTVTGVGAAGGGTVEMVTAPASGETLTISRSVPLTQEVDLANRGGVQPEVLETAYDKLTQALQDKVELLDRMPRFPVSSSLTGVELPLTLVANTALVVNAGGTGYATGPTTSEISAAQGYATNAAASATLASQWASLNTGIVASTDYSSKAWSIGGTGVTTTAGKGAAKEWATATGAAVDTAEYSAKEYATGTTVAVGSAKRWAADAEDSVVAGGLYSSLHYSAKAADSATAAAASAASIGLTTRGDLLKRGASANERLAIGGADTVLLTDGTDPAWGQVSLTAGVTGTLPLANGGTGATSLSGAGIAALAAAQTFTAAQRGTITVDPDLSFDQDVTNNFQCTPSGTGALTFTNHTAGQSGNILLINTGGHAISLAATTKGDANLATTISAAGTYWLSYYDDGTNAYVVTSAVFA
jgi:hypothetical protein